MPDAQHAAAVLHVALESFIYPDLAQRMQKDSPHLLSYLARTKLLGTLRHRRIIAGARSVTTHGWPFAYGRASSRRSARRLLRIRSASAPPLPQKLLAASP